MLLLATAMLLLTKAWHYPVSAMRDAYAYASVCAFHCAGLKAYPFEQRRLRCYVIFTARSHSSKPVRKARMSPAGSCMCIRIAVCTAASTRCAFGTGSCMMATASLTLRLNSARQAPRAWSTGTRMAPSTCTPNPSTSAASPTRGEARRTSERCPAHARDSCE